MTRNTAWKRATAAALPLLGLVSAQIAQAKQPPLELTPSSPWQVDWALSSCGARRLFGTDDNAVFVQLELFSPGATFQLVLTGKPLRGILSPDRLSIQYGQNGFIHRPSLYLDGKTKEGVPSVFIASSSLAERGDAVTPDLEARIDRITVSGGARPVILDTGSLGRLFVELRKCTDQLLESWGLDPAQQKRLSRPATPKSRPGLWLGSEDYPRRQLAEGRQSLVNFRLAVGADGKPTACEIQGAYSGKDFTDVTCRALMNRARFEPALDEKGTPTASYYVDRVSWVMRY